MSGLAYRVDSWQLPLSILLNSLQLATPQFQTHTRHYVKLPPINFQQTALERLTKDSKSLLALCSVSLSQLPTSVKIDMLHFLTKTHFSKNIRVFSSHVFSIFPFFHSFQPLIHKYVEYSFYLHLLQRPLAWWLYHSLSYHKLFQSFQRNYRLNYIFILIFILYTSK